MTLWLEGWGYCVQGQRRAGFGVDVELRDLAISVPPPPIHMQIAAKAEELDRLSRKQDNLIAAFESEVRCTFSCPVASVAHMRCTCCVCPGAFAASAPLQLPPPRYASLGGLSSR